MASDSSPSTPRCTYDVFLSFRGEDTRDNFTDHLYTDLVRRGIRTFRDDQLKRGEKIAPELLKAIEKSRSSIVVFSKTYADSRWCLEELAKIMECRQEYGQIVLPIFYHVDPSDVRKQTGSFGEAFTRHEENWKNKVQKWREALTDAGNNSGWHVKEGYESEHIKDIATTIANRISNCELLFVEDNLVGMDSHFKKISLGLSTESNDVRMIGISGIGGIGKTTIAGYVYDQISRGFECSSFLEEVGEIHKNKGMLHLQNQLLNDIQVGGNQNTSTFRRGAHMIKNSLRSQKALIVFDDVDDIDQLEFLVGNHDWYGKGSRIIITTRDRHWLTILKVDYLYEVKGLNSKEALKLFSQRAFLPNVLKEDYGSLLDRVIDYCQGLPLALKVLGSLLCGKTVNEWQSELDKLEKEPVVKIQNVLKRSFYELDRTQKKIFLDIACFFKGENKDFASRILDSCDLYGKSGIQVLQERCLITILHNRIYMHNLIQQMAWEIVREQHPEDPSKWSRLWNVDDIYRAFTSEQAMENTETISLDLSRSKQMQFMTKTFARMKKLRLLKVHWRNCGFMQEDNKLILPENFEFLSYELRYLHWEGYPLKSLPSNFYGENLVEIKLQNSNMRQLWQGNKCLGKLKVLDLKGSKQLIEIPNFSNISNLEKLNLTDCTSLDKIDPSIKEVKNLNDLNLIGCKKLRSLPSSMQHLDSLEILSLCDCSNLGEFPKIRWSCKKGLKFIWLDGTPIKELPFSIDDLTSVYSLYMRDCKNLRSLPSSICRLKSLQYFCLHGCSNLETFPGIIKSPESLQDSPTLVDLHNSNLMDGAVLNDLWCPSSLEVLELGGNNFPHIPTGITRLCNLTSLKISHCKMLEDIPGLPLSLEEIDAHDCTSLETLSSRSSLLWSSLLQWFKSAKIFVDLEHSVRRISGIVIPGSSGIPGWVSHREMEREVRIELPENWYKDNRFLGFGLFCLYQNYHTFLELNCDLKLHDDDDDADLPEFLLYLDGCADCDSDDVSDELWVTYCAKICIPEKYHSNQFKHIQASFSAIFDDETINSAIRSCGIHLIYSQDHEQKNTLLLDDDLRNNFQYNIESIAEDTNNGNVKRSREDAEQNQAEEPPHKRSRTFFSIFNSFTRGSSGIGIGSDRCYEEQNDSSINDVSLKFKHLSLH